MSNDCNVNERDPKGLILKTVSSGSDQRTAIEDSSERAFPLILPERSMMNTISRLGASVGRPRHGTRGKLVHVGLGWLDVSWGGRFGMQG
jgi:hypothetical protein